MSSELIGRSCRIVAKLLVEDIINDLERKKILKRKGRVWVKKWIARRQNLGASDRLLRELSTEDSASFKNHLRMRKENFDDLLQRVTPYIEKKNTTMRDALSAELKLQVTFRYLASGESLKSLFLYALECTSHIIFIIF
ncbi:hypothetical protein NQ314_012556 [Rhamnusium bicolor]|uniref:Uncharacterized protein n=1 Tax=Rhamnusium bicolor TaxID=1586634 RepID=A0AAV8XBT7_9CUCU|nr:hypothetical protein NQ314_012556 [Rhamnusium bicolor]